MDDTFNLRELGIIAQFIQLAALCASVALVLHVARRGMQGNHLILLASVMAVPQALFCFLVSDTVWAFEDFRKAYWKAGHAVLSGPQNLIEAFDLKMGTEAFVNIPIVAYLFAPLGLLDARSAGFLFSALGIPVMGITVWLLAKTFRLSARSTAILILAFSTFGPLYYSFRQGNTSHLAIPALLAGILLVRARKDFLAGVIYGAAAVFKLPLLLVGVYYFLRGRFGVAMGGAAVLAVTGVLSLLVFGWDMHVLWYEVCVAPFGKNPIPAFNAQSIAATFAKFELSPDMLNVWRVHEVSPLAGALSRGINAALVLGAALVIWRGRRLTSKETLDGELIIMVVLACLLSPLSWSHYYAWLVIPFAFLLAKAEEGLLGRRALVVLGASWLLSAPLIFWYESRQFGIYAIIGNLHLMVGSLMMLGLMIYWRERRNCMPA